MDKAREFQKNIYFCFIDYAKAFDCVDLNKLWKILKEMATHASTLVWRIPWRVEPGRLQSLGSQRVGQDWVTLLTYLLIVIHTVKGFGIVNKAEIDVLLELSCFIHDPADVGNLISGSSAFSKASLNVR